MTVSQPDGDGQSSSLALLIWMMITTMPQPLPPRCPGPCVAAIVTATSSGWRGERRMKPCVQLRSTRMELDKRRPRDGRGGGEGRMGTVGAWRISFIQKNLGFMGALFMKGAI